MPYLKTLFNGFISFGYQPFDKTPDADNDDGIIFVPTVCLDGDFTLNDLKKIVAEMGKRIESGEMRCVSFKEATTI